MGSSGRLLFAAALAVLSAGGPPSWLGCARSSSHPNVVLVSIDTLRLDHTSVGGYHRSTTPRLLELARGGVFFENAYSPAATTAPSHATMLTGRHPISHGVLRNSLPLRDELDTLAEVFTANGYESIAVAGSFVMSGRFGFAQGFARYDERFERSTIGPQTWQGHPIERFDRYAEEVTDRALGLVAERADPDAPLFLFVHYFDPHVPYAPPGEFGMRFVETGVERHTREHALQLYDGEIAYTDTEIGRLLDGLAKLASPEETLVIVTADHGEAFQDHGVDLHGLNLYEEIVRVPLIMSWSGVIPPGRRIPEPIGLIDLAPTLLELADLDPHSLPFEGESLARVVRGETSFVADRAIFFHRRPFPGVQLEGVFVKGPQYAVRQGRWKYIYTPELDVHELYDLELDPRERHDRLNENPRVAEQLAGRIADWKERYERPPSEPLVAEDVQRGLEALGYVE